MSIEIKVTRTVADDFYAGALREYLQGIMYVAHEYLANVAPRDERTLAGSLRPGNGVTEVDQNNPPEWAAVGVPAGEVARYGWALEDPSLHPNASWTPHYRTEALRGKPTEGWFTSVEDYMPGKMAGGKLESMADAIEAAWRR